MVQPSGRCPPVTVSVVGESAVSSLPSDQCTETVVSVAPVTVPSRSPVPLTVLPGNRPRPSRSAGIWLGRSPERSAAWAPLAGDPGITSSGASARAAVALADVKTFPAAPVPSGFSVTQVRHICSARPWRVTSTSTGAVRT